MKLWVCLAGVAVGCSWFQSEPPDVVFITVDTLRRDHVGAYNTESPARTPHMDSLAADGVRYTDAFSPISVTGPAFVSLMTGLEPGQHGVLTNLFRGGEPLSDDVDTLAERFSAAGYATGAFVSAFTLRQGLGLRQGFDVYNGGERSNREGAVTVSLLGPWLGAQEGKLFAWGHLFDPHGPVVRFIEPADSETDWERDPARLEHFPGYQRIDDITDSRLYQKLYVRGVEYADTQVGVMIAQLKALDRYDDAIIVLLADHGEGFEERELWYDHGTSAHVEQTQIPLVIKYPKNRRAGTTDDRLVTLLDVSSTVLKFTGLPPLEGSLGRSLLGTDVLHEVVLAESSHCKRIPVLNCGTVGGQGKELAVRSKGDTVVSQTTKSGDRVFTYDRQMDAAETSPQMGAVPAGLSDAVTSFTHDRRTRAYSPLPNIASRGAEEEKLKQLGYLE
jgi:arylsulfatase A-like enzyme